MVRNVGTADRVLRMGPGAALLALAAFGTLQAVEITWVKYGAALIGIVMLGSAATAVCPIYTLLGIKTIRS